jgi:hypothetical protein
MKIAVVGVGSVYYKQIRSHETGSYRVWRLLV